MGTFIQDAIEKHEKGNHAYEDVIVQGQIIYARSIIEGAINRGKTSVVWCYVYDSYDSYTTCYDDILGSPQNEQVIASYLTSAATAGGCYHGSTCDLLYNLVYNHKAGGPGVPASFDYEYVEREVKRGLLELGCKKADVFIGPRATTERRIVGSKKNLWTGKTTYEYMDFDIQPIKWMIRVSW